MLIVVPTDPLRPHRADEAFAADVIAAQAQGWQVAAIDIDELTGDNPTRAVSRVSVEAERSIYRGWMLRSTHYEALYRLLRARNVTLATDPAQYRSAHELPGWYATFRDYTALSVWTTSPDPVLLADLARTLPSGPGFVKDWVKSMKHAWHDAAYVPDVEDPAAVKRVASQFLELRGVDLVGGLVLRAFEYYQPEEYRSWWVGGTCVGISAHPDTPDRIPPEGLRLEPLVDPVGRLGSAFVTVDVALSVNGSWRVVEGGDGQVSDRPASLPAADLWRWLAS